MSASFLKNSSKKAYLYVHTLWKTQSISNSIGAPITRPHFHQSHASYSRFPQRKVKEMEFSVPLATAATSSKGFSSISNNALIGWYLGMVKTRPILTKSVTSAFIYTAADLSSQTIAGSPSDSYDLVRTVRMAGYGMILLGPSLHFWFNFVSRLFPKRDLFSTFKKMFMGQAIFGPIMTVVFFSVNAGLQGESGSEIVARLKRDLIPTLINGVMYWPVCDFVTFRFIPVHLQPLVSNSFAYIWTVYMTYMAGLEKAGTK
ncbi:hypothetical protein HanRHA438_Chr16g0749811 [Helianthus annuus]|nr:hypothetical protein HanIR_Chr16g0801791 [Helianthus annuus]KAJ0820369.1 hypothetical protein HanPSC8_Chr16g0707131 [Helianthus annuus]KAJ0834977.1 hypothetical protein HanRHA438_Chr16g0749811 [Helianthus annuus]